MFVPHAQILLDAKVIDEATWADALKNSLRLGTPIEDILKERDIITGHVLYQIVSDALGIPYVNLKLREIPDEVLGLFDNETVGEYKAIPFEVDSKKRLLKVAFLDPTDKKRISSLERKVKYAIQVYFCGTNSFHAASKFYRKGVASQMKALIEQMIAENTPHSFFYQRDDPSKHRRLFEKLVEYVYYTQPSDVHIEHVRDGGMIKLRVDGFLRDEFEVLSDQVTSIINQVKLACGIATDQSHQTRDGRFSREVFGERLAFRISVMPTYYGEKVCARVLNESYQKMSLSDLGCSKDTIATLKTEIKKPYGLVLMTGPTGSGKSSTVYNLLKSLNVEGASIATIEDPVEYSIKHINQTQADTEHGFTFAVGLRAILRQDPNVVMVGEIRDGETASIALQAALTGHLVLSTLHANSAVSALTRLRNMDIRSYQLAPTVNAIVNQRLVKALCPFCREKYAPGKRFLSDMQKDTRVISSLEKLHKQGAALFKDISDIGFYRGRGCSRCHGRGSFGRVGLFEVLRIDPAISRMILSEKSEGVINKHATENGMLTLFEDGLLKVLDGRTTIGEVVRVLT